MYRKKISKTEYKVTFNIKICLIIISVKTWFDVTLVKEKVCFFTFSFLRISPFVCGMFKQAFLYLSYRMKPFDGLIMKLSLIVVKCRISFRHRNQQKVLILRAVSQAYFIRARSSI